MTHDHQWIIEVDQKRHGMLPAIMVAPPWIDHDHDHEDEVQLFQLEVVPKAGQQQQVLVFDRLLSYKPCIGPLIGIHVHHQECILA